MSDLIDRQALLKQIDIDSDGEPGYYGDTWKFIDTIKSMPPATQLSTNLAEVGTDCISRQAAIKATWQDTGYTDPFNVMTAIRDRIQQLPPIRPDSYSEIPNNSDTISRQDAVSRRRLLSDLKELITAWEKYPVMAEQIKGVEVAIGYVELIPSAQPEIIRCRNCKFASGDSRICMKFDHSPIGELDFCAWAERRTDE